MRPTNWQNTPIGQLEPLPTDRIPVSNRADQGQAMYNIVEHIQRIIEKIRQKTIS